MKRIPTVLLATFALFEAPRVYAQQPQININGCIDTALGCINPDPASIFTKFFDVGIGLAGGIAFLLIIFGGLQIMTSTGNPEKLNEGRELVVSAIAGLLLIIFSVFILRLIGVNILGVFR
ncbi:hypothetical protein M1555_04125 [Patescibacteria group bacterium]|nr:hypothetical protein [Patescibacteria group bacterium]